MPFGQVLRAIGALVFQQVAQVVIAEDPEQPAPAARRPGELEIDEGRSATAGDQQVGFLREVVVHDVSSVQLPQQRQKYFHQ